MRKKGIIQSVDRALSLLEVLEESPKESLSLPELAEHAPGDTATVHRQLKTLLLHGLVDQDPFNKRYSLGPSLLRLSQSLYKKLRIQSMLRPFLVQLADQTRETCHLAVLAVDRAVFVDQVTGCETVTVNTAIGDSEPLYCTAVGKALIAFQPEPLRDRLIRDLKLRRVTPNTIIRKTRLRQEIQEIRESGVAFDREEYVPGVNCAASPIFNVREELVCTIGLSGPSTRIPTEKLEELRTIVKTIARKASRRMGSDGTIFDDGK